MSLTTVVLPPEFTPITLEIAAISCVKGLFSTDVWIVPGYEDVSLDPFALEQLKGQTRDDR